MTAEVAAALAALAANIPGGYTVGLTEDGIEFKVSAPHIMIEATGETVGGALAALVSGILDRLQPNPDLMSLNVTREIVEPEPPHPIEFAAALPGGVLVTAGNGATVAGWAGNGVDPCQGSGPTVAHAVHDLLKRRQVRGALKLKVKP